MLNKKLLSLVLVISLLMTFAVGCGKKDEKTKEKETTENVENKGEENTENQEDTENAEEASIDEDQYLNVYMNSQPTTLDPSKGSDTYGWGIIMNTLEPLIRVADDEDGKSVFVGAGAETWDVSEDGLTYTFHLRKNKWDDGEEVTSKDYLYGIQKSVNPLSACPYSNFLFPIENAQKINAGEGDMADLGVEAPDDYTLVIKLETPVPYFLDLVTQRVYFPQREDLDKKYGDTYSTAPETTPSCGPFRIPNWTINSEIILEKNSEYWDVENVKLSKINIKIIGDVNTIYNALKTGELDYAGVTDPQWKGDFLKDDSYEFIEKVNPWTGFMVMNVNSETIKNAKMRKALSIALDRRELIDATMDGIPVQAYNFVPPTITSQELPFNEDEKGPIKDLQDENPDAKALFIEGMQDAGLGDDPSTLTLNFIGSGTDQKVRSMSEYIKQNLEEVLGVNVEVNQSEWNAFFSKLQGSDYDMAWLGYGATYNDPSSFLDVFNSKSPTITTNWVNQEFDADIEKAQVETDPAKRVEILKDAERKLVYDDAVVVPINHSRSNTFIRKYVKNASFNFFNTEGYKRMYTQGR